MLSIATHCQVSQKSCGLHCKPWAGNDRTRTARARQSQTGSINCDGCRGTMQKASAMYSFGKKQPWPNCCSCCTAWSRDWSCTCASSGEIPALIESPGGYDKLWINLNVPGTFFSTTPREDVRKCEKGSCLKGPAILFMLDSVLNILSTSSGFCMPRSSCEA